ncbi:MAG: hypothetical protein ABJB40_14545 [Acidobacteriota bacterium]
MLKRIFALLAVVTVLVASGSAQQKTEVRSTKAKQRLLGRHKISLQWISWDYFGVANITGQKGVFYLKGRQDGRKSTDFVSVDGVITSIDDKEFAFKGKVVTQISHIFGGKPCARDGEMTFRITGKRKYWRMQEIDNPCDEAADYVDIYFR